MKLAIEKEDEDDIKDKKEDKKDEKKESADKTKKEKESKDKSESKSKSKKKPEKKDNTTEINGKRIKTVGSLSELLRHRIDETIPKIKHDLPLMLIAGINKDDHEKVKGHTIKVMARAKKDKLLEKEQGVDNNGIHVVADRAKMSVESWTTLESYCRIQNYRLIKSDQEMILILESWLEE